MADVVTDWREEYAYTLGLQAYIYGFPWVFLPQLRWQWVTQPAQSEMTPSAALNHFWHAKTLADATYRDGGCPDHDEMYSIAWVDVRKEPVILSHPDMGERYYSFQLASLDSDNFAYVGKRTTGPHDGHFAIVGPGWKGSLPPPRTRWHPHPRRRCSLSAAHWWMDLRTWPTCTRCRRTTS